MTITQSLAEWLFASQLFPGSAGIPLDQLGPEDVDLALLASETRSLPLLDGSRECTCRVLLMLRAASQTPSARLRARALLEDVCAWVREQDASGSLPELTGRRIGLSISPAGCGAARSRTDSLTVYQLPLDFVYWEG